MLDENLLRARWLIGLIQSDAKFMDERDHIAAYINTLKEVWNYSWIP